jgi:tRNA(Arg) A34 adenosine deaminase TadA
MGAGMGRECARPSNSLVAHAEIVAMREDARCPNDQRLTNPDLYVAPAP